MRGFDSHPADHFMEHNILLGSFLESDKELFFGPLRPHDIFIIEDHLLEYHGCGMAHLLKTLGLFESSSQARKAGWTMQVPKGYSEFVVGKLKTRICILNI